MNRTKSKNGQILKQTFYSTRRAGFVRFSFFLDGFSNDRATSQLDW